MAREVIVIMRDDLDRVSEADTTEVIGFRGYNYILDLSQKNADELEALLQPYLDAAHDKIRIPRTAQPRVEPAGRAGTTPAFPGMTDHATAGMSKEMRRIIREWARRNGYEVAARGIIARDIVAAYEAATEKERTETA